MSKINVIGQGYIGLPTTLMFAANGADVVGTDYNAALIESLEQGKLTFEEKGLPELFEQALKSGVEFSTKYQKADIYIVAVPTPYIKTSKKLDPTYIISAVHSILDVCDKGSVIVIESTIAPGTIDMYIRPEVSDRGFEIGKDIHLAHAPERIIPGNMIYELEYNSKTIGADSEEIGLKIKDLYSMFCKGDIVITDIQSAEMSKVVENTYRDINIAFANELAKICHEGNLDVYEIVRLANMHPRVNILSPGPGVGGHCISVDPWFLVGDYPGLANIILSARQINDSMPAFVLERVREVMKELDLHDFTRVGLYGLTYKENVDDTRESPTLQLLELLDKRLAPALKSYDPFITKPIVDNQILDFDEFLDEIDVLVVMVGHEHIKNHLDKIKDKVIFDTKNVIELESVYKL